MINRLNEFIAQTKGISTSRWIYFDKGFSYTYGGEQLVQAKTDFKEDKKGGEYFSDKTFKVQVDDFNDFLKEYKKSIIGTNVLEDNTLEVKTSIPNVKLEFKWDKKDDLKLQEIKNFFGNLDLDEEKKVFDYDFTKDEITKFVSEKSNRIFADFLSSTIAFDDEGLEEYLMISIFPKYLGKILSSTKEMKMKIYDTDKAYIYLIQYTVKNMNITTDYYGLCSDLIPIQEGGLE